MAAVSNLPFEQFAALRAVPQIAHAFTTRVAGIDVKANKAEALRRLDAVHREIRDSLGARDLPFVVGPEPRKCGRIASPGALRGRAPARDRTRVGTRVASCTGAARRRVAARVAPRPNALGRRIATFSLRRRFPPVSGPLRRSVAPFARTSSRRRDAGATGAACLCAADTGRFRAASRRPAAPGPTRALIASASAARVGHVTVLAGRHSGSGEPCRLPGSERDDARRPKPTGTRQRKIPAATYSPRKSPSKYHRRGRA